MAFVTCVATAAHRVMEARHLRGIQRRSTASARHGGSAEPWRQALLTCGILAPVLYVAMTLFIGLLWEGYSVVSRVPSELSAIGAPTRPLWIWLGVVYCSLWGLELQRLGSDSASTRSPRW